MDAKDGVGGDWFDVIPLSGARVGLVIGDVVGHGIGAAATMGRLRTAVQTLADMDLPPDELLARLDDLVLRLSEEERAGGPAERGGTTVVGATCLYAVYDPANGSCTMARAGHPPPVVVTPDNTVSFPDLPAGPPLGLGGLPFESLEIELPEGSLLGLYTDGLIEGADKDLGRGMERLGRAVSRDGMPLEDLCPAVVKELLPVPQPDDIALLLARTHRLSPEHLASWDVPVDPAAVGETRAQVSHAAGGVGAGGSVDDDGADRQRTGDQRDPVRRGPGTAAAAVPVGADLRGVRRQQHLTAAAARQDDRRGRARTVPGRPARASVGHALHPQGKIIWAEQPLP